MTYTCATCQSEVQAECLSAGWIPIRIDEDETLCTCSSECWVAWLDEAVEVEQ
jgi:DNA-directed RNA polymerase subunit RPC12/RpoP